MSKPADPSQKPQAKMTEAEADKIIDKGPLPSTDKALAAAMVVTYAKAFEALGSSDGPKKEPTKEERDAANKELDAVYKDLKREALMYGDQGPKQGAKSFVDALEGLAKAPNPANDPVLDLTMKKEMMESQTRSVQARAKGKDFEAAKEAMAKSLGVKVEELAIPAVPVAVKEPSPEKRLETFMKGKVDAVNGPTESNEANMVRDAEKAAEALRNAKPKDMGKARGAAR